MKKNMCVYVCMYVWVCMCVCVFNNMCVLERATDRPTPTERWCVVYDLATRVGASSRFRASGRDRRTAATPAPDQPGPPKAPPSPARFPPETVSAAPKNWYRIHARAERMRPLTGACVEGRSGFKSDGCFVRPTYRWVYVI